MNKVTIMGRLTRDPEIRVAQGENPLTIARYTLAVDRPKRKNAPADAQTVDFISCVAMGSSGLFAEKFLKKGTPIIASGRLEVSSYKNKDGNMVWKTEVKVNEHFFPLGAKTSESTGTASATQDAPAEPDFMDVPDEEELPFN